MRPQIVVLCAFLSAIVPRWTVADNDFTSCRPDDDDSKYIQSRIEEAKSGDGVVRLPSGCFRITRQIVIRDAEKGIDFEMLPTAEIEAWLPGNYAFKVSNTNYGVFRLNLVIKTSDGGGVLFESSPDTGNTMYNTLSGRIIGDTRDHPAEIAKPAQGIGSIGVGFRLVRDRKANSGSRANDVVKFANYFNRVKDLVIRKMDTGIFLGFDSNAQIVDNLQVEKYWYGVVIHSDENRLTNGFCHLSHGRNDTEQTECIHMGSTRGFNRLPSGTAAKTFTTFNQIMGFIAEPGPLSRAIVMEGGNRGNFIEMGDNANSANITEPGNHIIRWRSASFANF